MTFKEILIQAAKNRVSDALIRRDPDPGSTYHYPRVMYDEAEEYCTVYLPNCLYLPGKGIPRGPVEELMTEIGSAILKDRPALCPTSLIEAFMSKPVRENQRRLRTGARTDLFTRLHGQGDKRGQGLQFMVQDLSSFLWEIDPVARYIWMDPVVAELPHEERWYVLHEAVAAYACWDYATGAVDGVAFDKRRGEHKERVFTDDLRAKTGKTELGARIDILSDSDDIYIGTMNEARIPNGLFQTMRFTQGVRDWNWLGRI